MKYSQWILVILGVFCVATWLGCGDDDDDDSGGGGDKGDMVGTWRLVDDTPNDQSDDNVMMINSNGTWSSNFEVELLNQTYTIR